LLGIFVFYLSIAIGLSLSFLEIPLWVVFINKKCFIYSAKTICYIFNLFIYYQNIFTHFNMTTEGPKFNETNVYRVRRESRLNQGLFLCKLIIKKHGNIQIEGMGESISLVAKLSQILQKNGLATTTSIISASLDRENSRSINPKLTIVLTKSAQFDKLTEGLELRQWCCKKYRNCKLIIFW